MLSSLNGDRGLALLELHRVVTDTCEGGHIGILIPFDREFKVCIVSNWSKASKAQGYQISSTKAYSDYREGESECKL